MKQILFTLALPLAVALMAFNQTGCQPAAEPVANNAPAVAKETPPDTAAITTELLRIENDWPRVIKERDVASVKAIEAEDIVWVYPDGSTGGKAQDVADFERDALSADSLEQADLKVNVLDNDAAVVSGRSIVKGGKYKTSDGKSTRNISGEYRWIDTFVRRNGKWQIVASAGAKIENPSASASPTPKASPAMTATPAMKASPAMTKPSPVTKAPPPPAAKTTP